MFNGIEIEAFNHPYLYLFSLSLILCVFVSYSCFKNFNGEKLYNKFFILCNLTLGSWAFLAILQLLLQPTMAHIYIRVLILTVATVYAWSFIMFIYYYTDTSISKKIAWISSLPLVGILIITLISFYNNFESYDIYVTTKDVGFYTITLEQNFPLRILILIHFIYGIIGLIVLGLFARRQKDTNRNQYYWLLTAMSVIVIGAFISALRLDPYPDIHIYPAFFVIFFLVIWKSIYNDNFFTIIPIARTKILENLTQGVIVINDDKKIIDYNNSVKEILGNEDLYLENIFKVCPKIKNKNINFRKENCINNFSVGEEYNKNYYNIFITPLYDNESDYIGSIISFEDITTLKEKTKELENKNKKLENFASILSHDIRNPLSVSKGYSELIKQEPTNEEYHKNLDEGLNRIETIIDDILKLTREGNNLDELKDTDLESIVDESWGMLEFSDATLYVENTMKFKSDKSRLKNVLENIFRNAEDHSPNDKSTKIRVGTLSDNNGFYIEDDGEGIPDNKKDTVFKYGVTDSEDGTGLGLAIVNEIINAHGWKIIAIDGKKLNGARFEIIFDED